MAEPIAGVGYLAGQCGYTGTAWQKLGMVWGFYDTVSEIVLDSDLPAGASILSGALVPAGEVWVISSIAVQVTSATITGLLAWAFVDGVEGMIIAEFPPTSGRWYVNTGMWVLAEGDKMQFQVAGATAGDAFNGRYIGYKMRLDL